MAMFNVANCNQLPEGNQPVPVVVMPAPVTGHRSEQIDKGRIGGGAGPALLEKNSKQIGSSCEFIMLIWCLFRVFFMVLVGI